MYTCAVLFGIGKGKVRRPRRKKPPAKPAPQREKEMRVRVAS